MERNFPFCDFNSNSVPGGSRAPITYRRAIAARHLGTYSPVPHPPPALRPGGTRCPDRPRGGGEGTWRGQLRLRGQVGQDGCGAGRAGRQALAGSGAGLGGSGPSDAAVVCGPRGRALLSHRGDREEVLY